MSGAATYQDGYSDGAKAALTGKPIVFPAPKPGAPVSQYTKGYKTAVAAANTVLAAGFRYDVKRNDFYDAKRVWKEDYEKKIRRAK